MARSFATEDRELNKASIITSRTRLYSDIDLTFTNLPADSDTPFTDIYKKKDAAAVKQAIKNLLLTNFYEKPFNPFYGGNLRDLLFELADEDIEDDIRNNITRAIQSFEPRARIIDIKVKNQPDYNSVDVTIEFQIVNTEQTVIYTTTLVRLR